MDGLPFADNLIIYIITRNQKVAARAIQGVTSELDAWAAERRLTFSTSKTANMVYGIYKKNNEKRGTNVNHTKNLNHTI